MQDVDTLRVLNNVKASALTLLIEFSQEVGALGEAMSDMGFDTPDLVQVRQNAVTRWQSFLNDHIDKVDWGRSVVENEAEAIVLVTWFGIRKDFWISAVALQHGIA